MKQGLLSILSLIFVISISDTINQLFLKSAVNSVTLSGPVTLKKIASFVLSLLRLRRVWIAAIFSTLSFGIWIFVLSRVDLNFAFSIDSMHYIFIAFASRVVLKEKVGFLRWFGTILTIAGIAIVSLS